MLVTAQAAQVEVKEDTLQYNVSAYRVPEGSALEELVKKKENPSKIKLLLTELKNLAIGVSGSLIASGIAAQIPMF